MNIPLSPGRPGAPFNPGGPIKELLKTGFLNNVKLYHLILVDPVNLHLL